MNLCLDLISPLMSLYLSAQEWIWLVSLLYTDMAIGVGDSDLAPVAPFLPPIYLHTLDCLIARKKKNAKSHTYVNYVIEHMQCIHTKGGDRRLAFAHILPTSILSISWPHLSISWPLPSVKIHKTENKLEVTFPLKIDKR